MLRYARLKRQDKSRGDDRNRSEIDGWGSARGYNHVGVKSGAWMTQTHMQGPTRTGIWSRDKGRAVANQLAIMSSHKIFCLYWEENRINIP